VKGSVWRKSRIIGKMIGKDMKKKGKNIIIGIVEGYKLRK